MSVKYDMEALLWANGCDLETAKFASRMLEQGGFALVRTEYLDSIGTPFASCHSHEQACERLRRINSATYSGVPSKQVGKEEFAPVSSIIPATKGGEDERTVAWLIERRDYAGSAQPHWYADNPDDGWHWWTSVAVDARHFASKAEAEVFPAYRMIASDPAISITEHVFLAALSAQDTDGVAKP